MRMLLCGRSDIIPQALAMLGPEKVNAINIQAGRCNLKWNRRINTWGKANNLKMEHTKHEKKIIIDNVNLIK